MVKKRVAILLDTTPRYIANLTLEENNREGYTHRILVFPIPGGSDKFHQKILVGGPEHASCSFTDDPENPRIKTAGTIEVDLANIKPSYEATTTICPTRGKSSDKQYWRFGS